MVVVEASTGSVASVFFPKVENYVVQFYAWCSFVYSFVLMYGNML